MDNRLAVLLLHHYAEGDSEIQKLIMDYLLKHGMVDPWGFFNSAMKTIRCQQTGSAPLGVIEEEEDEVDATDGKGGSHLMSMVDTWLNSWTDELAFFQNSHAAATKQPTK